MTWDIEATEEFPQIFDKFFDLCNTRSVQGKEARPDAILQSK